MNTTADEVDSLSDPDAKHRRMKRLMVASWLALASTSVEPATAGADPTPPPEIRSRWELDRRSLNS